MFAFRLALALGMTYSRLCREMDSLEFTQWIEFFTTIEPFPSERNAWGHAQTAAITAAAHRGRGQRAPSAKDFLVGFGRRAAQSAEEMTANFRAFADAAARLRRGAKKPQRHGERG